MMTFSQPAFYYDRFHQRFCNRGWEFYKVYLVRDLPLISHSSVYVSFHMPAKYSTCVVWFFSKSRLDSRLYKFCHNDAVNMCSAPKNWHTREGTSDALAPSLGPIVLSCLYRQVAHITDDNPRKVTNFNVTSHQRLHSFTEIHIPVTGKISRATIILSFANLHAFDSCKFETILPADTKTCTVDEVDDL